MNKSGENMISRSELVRLSICNSEQLPQLINDQGIRKRWVGIGWCDEGPPKGDEVILVDDCFIDKN